MAVADLVATLAAPRHGVALFLPSGRAESAGCGVDRDVLRDDRRRSMLFPVSRRRHGIALGRGDQHVIGRIIREGFILSSMVTQDCREGCLVVLQIPEDMPWKTSEGLIGGSKEGEGTCNIWTKYYFPGLSYFGSFDIFYVLEK